MLFRGDQPVDLTPKAFDTLLPSSAMPVRSFRNALRVESSQVSRDGQWIVFQKRHGPTRMTLWKAPVSAGDPVQLTSTMSMRPAVPPDGRLIAYYYMDAERWRLAVMSIAGGQPIARFDIPPTSGSRVVRWMPDRGALPTSTSATVCRTSGCNLWRADCPSNLPIFRPGASLILSGPQTDRGLPWWVRSRPATSCG